MDAGEGSGSICAVRGECRPPGAWGNQEGSERGDCPSAMEMGKKKSQECEGCHVCRSRIAGAE